MLVEGLVNLDTVSLKLLLLVKLLGFLMLSLVVLVVVVDPFSRTSTGFVNFLTVRT